MAFRTRRQARYKVLRQSGFLPTEANKISKVPFKAPYMKQILKERLKDYNAAIQKGWTKERYEKAIKELYKIKKWQSETRAGITINDPWIMLKEYEKRYRNRHPEYTSPWEPRRKDYAEFTRKLEANIKKHPKGTKPIKIKYLPEGGAEIIE